MTIKDVEVEEKADSYRWLMGEKSDAFGGAIRDMWNPTCYGDPGKVSDAEYICGTEDSGGVHSNSGVINHGYAFLVDGGTFNGATIDGIGIDQGAGDLLPGDDGVPDADQQLRRPRRRSRGLVHRPDRPDPQGAEHGRRTTRSTRPRRSRRPTAPR